MILRKRSGLIGKSGGGGGIQIQPGTGDKGIWVGIRSLRGFQQGFQASEVSVGRKLRDHIFLY